MEKGGTDEKHVVDTWENSPKNTLDGKISVGSLDELSKKTLDGEFLVNTSEDSAKETLDDKALAGIPDNSPKKGLLSEMKSLDLSVDDVCLHHEKEGLNENVHKSSSLKSGNPKEESQSTEEVLSEEKKEGPVFDGTEAPELEATRIDSTQSLYVDSETQAYAWPERAVALKNFVKERGAVVVSNVIRRLSGKKDEDQQTPLGEEDKSDSFVKDSAYEADSNTDTKPKDVPQKAMEHSTWNPLNYIKIGRNVDVESKTEQVKGEDRVEPTVKGRIIVYTRLGCQECREVRLFMHQKRLRFIEINIDIYPGRKLELEKNTGSSAVPRIYLNDFLVGGLNELKAMDESGKLFEKINELVNEEPSPSAPLPPLPGEDDESGSGKIDELASIVKKMKGSIIVKDRFYKMRRFNDCFVGSEAVDFLAEDQYFEREEAVEFGRKLVSSHFFRHVLDENIFEDGNHLYRFLEHDPIISTQCYNIPKGIIDVKPKRITEIASRLRSLCFAMFEAYVSEDGRHVDYRSIYGSEEFKRYLRITEELQRVELGDLSREEKLAFFINLYNMMAIHAILVWGYPLTALDRRKFFGDFKYLVGGCAYSLSAIQNGILRGNQRPPYNLIKPFGVKDKRFKVALRYPEPLVHFALVCGARSGPALRCYSPGNVDMELMEAARDFLRNGGLVVDAEAKTASVSKILCWYSVDFGKTEIEVMKHVANYLEPGKSEELLEFLASTQLKVAYQPYDWSLNC